MRAFDIAKEAFDHWKTRTMDHALPGLEAFLITLVAVLAFQAIAITFSVMLMVGFIFGVLLVFISEASIMILAVLILATIVLALAFLGVIIASSALVQALSTGGLTGVLKEVVHGGKYDFGDVFSKGWGSIWTLFKIALLTLLIIIPLVVLPILVLIAPFVVIMVINPLFSFFFFFVYLFVLFVSLAMSIFIVPLTRLPYIVHWNEGKNGWQAVKGGFSFAFRHPGEVFGLGLLYMLATFVSRLIPGVGFLLSILGPPFMATCLQLLYDEKKGPMWKKEVR